ncbi:hypothetical protein [Marinifilum caeruleilacunae]|uniref:Uncharacterized protein n=1 Tax=Marinifilum caeruleilacunae TaxID=2499076 RepID=A0ABX1X0W0_9BACT|nr:hypothetical protein [Marinifilum caeruleilacunae]NOU62002.1 hypothetical protein [Marinifilum caeruleilacunae]
MIEGNKFIASFDTTSAKVIVERNQSILKIDQLVTSPDFEFIDFDSDSIPELVFYCIGCKAEVLTIFDYDSINQSFKLIKNIEDFPAPKNIEKTNLYYSYSPTGCADQNWESKLFRIENFKTELIGLLRVEACPDNDKNTAFTIDIFKPDNSNDLTFVEALPLDTINTYNENKWGFIKSYWENQYKAFTNNTPR